MFAAGDFAIARCVVRSGCVGRALFGRDVPVARAATIAGGTFAGTISLVASPPRASK